MSQLRSNVRKPFLVSRQNLTRAIQIRTQNFENDEKTQGELRLKDTDRDGISDYDEQYVYLTSAYLADSDSDGASDAEEIAQNQDPNCPQGKDCFDLQASVPQAATSTFVAEADANLAAVRSGAQPPQTGVEEFIVNPKVPESMTVQDTRAYIRAQGLLPADQLATLSDEAVMQAYRMSYQEALRIQSARAETSPSVSGSVSTTATSPSLQPTP